MQGETEDKIKKNVTANSDVSTLRLVTLALCRALSCTIRHVSSEFGEGMGEGWEHRAKVILNAPRASGQIDNQTTATNPCHRS